LQAITGYLIEAEQGLNETKKEAEMGRNILKNKNYYHFHRP